MVKEKLQVVKGENAAKVLQDMPARVRATTRGSVATWTMRAAFFAVFAMNVFCAVCFIVNPAGFAPNYELSGVAGMSALQGLGVAFLMWNATYPAFIVAPERYRVLGWVVLAQQVIGLVGELFILGALPAGHATLGAGIRLFITFDAAGLAAMLLSFAFWYLARCRAAQRADC